MLDARLNADALSLIADLANQVRTHYLRYLLSSAEQFRTLHANAVTELLLSVNGDRPQLYRYYRMDVAAMVDGVSKFRDVSPATFLNFSPIRTSLTDRSLFIASPISWCGVEFKVDTVGFDVSRLECWIEKWLDLEDANEVDSDGLQGAIHNVTEPELSENVVLFSVDFGSAPARCFTELVELLVSMGSTCIEISSSSLDIPG